MRILFIFLFCYCFSEEAFSQSDSVFNRNLISFIRTFRNKNNWNGKIVLINEPERITVSNWQRRKMLDDSFFTKEDKQAIQLQFEKSKKYKWQYVYAGNTTLVDSSKLMSIVYSGNGTGFGDFSQHTKSVIISLFQFLFS